MPNILFIYLIKMYGFRCMKQNRLVISFVIIQLVLFRYGFRNYLWPTWIFSQFFFQYNFTFQARDLRLVLHQILEHIDTFDIQNMRTSLTIHIYLNRPPYDLQLETSKESCIIFFLFLCMIYLNFFQYAFILKHVIHILWKELRSLSTSSYLVFSFFQFDLNQSERNTRLSCDDKDLLGVTRLWR